MNYEKSMIIIFISILASFTLSTSIVNDQIDKKVAEDLVAAFYNRLNSKRYDSTIYLMAEILLKAVDTGTLSTCLPVEFTP